MPSRSRPSRAAGALRRSHCLGVGLIGGVLVALSLPPFGWWPLGWLGMAILAAVLPGRTWRQRVAVGAGFGLADYAVGLLWVQEFSVYGYVAVVVVSALYVVLPLLLLPTGRRWQVWLGLPCLMVMSDWARDRFPLGGLPLAGISLGQAAGPLAPALRLGGSLLLTGETALAGVALAEMALLGSRAWRGRRRRGAARVPWAVAGAVATAAVAVAMPVAGLVSPSGAGGHLPPMRVALVQGGGPRGTRAVNTDPQTVFERQLVASDGLERPLDLVVWPEGMLQSGHTPLADTADAAAVASLARRLHTTVLVGVDQDVGRTHYINEVVAWNARGQVVGRYVKNHLVPFGEYVPYRSVIDKLFNVSDVPYDGIPGHSPGFLRTPAGPLGVMISYEVFFDGRARGGVRAGGQVLVVPTDTASYRSTQVPTQEVAADRLRAWETGRWLVQVTPTGFATVVSPEGAVVRRSPLDARTVIEASVPRLSGMTVYDHIGDTPVVAVAAVGWLVAVMAGRRPRLPARRHGARARASA